MNQPDPPSDPSEGDDSQNQQVRVSKLSARVPEKVGGGAFSTGAIMITGGSEFVLDFIQNFGQRPQVMARVIMPHECLQQFIEALKKNLETYERRFGPPPELPRGNPSERRPSPQEVYDELKLPDDLLCGAYANGVMICHTASEFKFDFLTNFFPHSAVSCRVFLSAPQVPRLLKTMIGTYQQFAKRVQQQQHDSNQPSDNPQGPFAENDGLEDRTEESG